MTGIAEGLNPAEETKVLNGSVEGGENHLNPGPKSLPEENWV